MYMENMEHKKVLTENEESDIQREDKLLNDMWNELKPASGYTPKRQEDLQAAWDAKKAAESAKFDPANLEQTKLFSEEDSQ